jgi:toxin ParE1/3/4
MIPPFAAWRRCPYPYLIFYQATEEELVIHAVRHMARDPSSMPGSA